MSKISAKSATQLDVVLSNTPGSLAQVAEALAHAGVNIEGVCHTEPSDKKAAMHHFVVDKVPAARKALKSLGRKFSEEKVLSLRYKDKPGILAVATRALGNAGVNIEEVYLSVAGIGKDTTLFVGVSDGQFNKAMKAVKKL